MPKKLIKLNNKKIIGIKKINELFEHIYYKEIDVLGHVLRGDFYLDTFNYFPITNKDLYTFPPYFDWQNQRKKFYSQSFEKNFFKKKIIKEISNAYVLGTNPSGNYFRNIFTFLNRLFFISEKEVNIAIHRNTPNNIRHFIKFILNRRKIKLIKFINLDDGFYFFRNSFVPSFLDLKGVIKLYQFFFPIFEKANMDNIFISRRNARWRKIINENEFYSHLKDNNFNIIEFENLKIEDQISMIQSAKKIISPHGSGLTNLIFANPNINIIEIIEKNIGDKLSPIYNKYKKISNYKKNKHNFFGADLINNDFNFSSGYSNISKYISEKTLLNSNYYKNFLLKESDFKKLITNFSKY